MTAGQINIWRAHVRCATLNAQIEGNEFSTYKSLLDRQRQAIVAQVQRATFCAKLDGFEYSRLKTIR